MLSQIEVIKFINKLGGLVKAFAAPFNIKEGLRTTFTASGNTVTIESSDGAGIDHSKLDNLDYASAAHTGFEASANKGAVSGYAPLDAAQKVPTVNLGGSGADNTKFLRGDQTWQAVTGGTTDHAALSNLDYASAGHTGFEPSQTKGDLTADSPLALSATRQVIGGAAVISLLAAYTPRERLTANRTYYVRTDGNDSNTGLVDSAAGAFLTIQAAVDAYQALDCNGYDVTIKVGDGTYTTGAFITSRVGKGYLYLEGNTSSPSSCVISVTSAYAIHALGHPNGSLIFVDGFKLQATGSGCGIVSEAGAFVLYKNIEFGACATAHMICSANGRLECSGNYTISGNATFHWLCSGARVVCNSKTITITGTPAFSYFCVAYYSGVVEAQGDTFNGSATGTKYYAYLNGMINTVGGSNYLPGSVGGSTVSGGQYL